jgi:peptide/nickel transport system ATP-binding protein
MSAAELLHVEDLVVRYRGESGPMLAVRGISFAMGQEKLAIVGESGSGKSTIGRALLKLLAPSTEVTAKRMDFRGTDLLAADERAMQQIRGRHIAMIMQDPKYSLNPLIPVGRQIAEAFLVHHRASSRVARAKAQELMRAVRIRDPERVYDLYPHQVSGGMGQRVMIAMMLIPEPELLIADEPTSALDVSVRLQVLAILDDLVQSRGLGLIFITHDLTIAQTFCDRVLVVYQGRIVESLAASQLAEAQHPYTRGLLACVPRPDAPHRRLSTLDRAALQAAIAP